MAIFQGAIFFFFWIRFADHELAIAEISQASMRFPWPERPLGIHKGCSATRLLANVYSLWCWRGVAGDLFPALVGRGGRTSAVALANIKQKIEKLIK